MMSAPTPETATDGACAPPRRLAWAAGAVAVVAVGLRLAAARGDLWFDEVWSLALLADVRRPWEIFTAIQHDNNHPLNSLFLWLLRGAPWDWLYRAPAVLAGLAALPLLWAAGRALGGRAMHGLAALALGGVSYWLVEYSTQARGYAFALPLALLAWLTLRRGLAADAAPGWRAPALYGAAAILALLAQPLALPQVLLPLGAWSAWVWWHRHGTSWAWALALLRWHTAPAVAALWFWWGFLRPMQIGNMTDRPDYHLLPLLGELGRFLLGLPVGGAVGAVGLGLVVAAALGFAVVCRPADRWFFLLAIVVAPALFVLLVRPPFLPPRYFFFSALFLLLLLADGLVTLAPAGTGWRRWVAAALAFGFVAGNLYDDAQLIHRGRGQYAQAVRAMAAAARSPVTTIGGIHDLRDGLLVAWFARRLPSDDVHYVTQDHWAAGVPEFFVINDLPGKTLPGQFNDATGQGWSFFGYFPAAAGLSGWAWYVYQRAAPAGRAISP